MAEQQRQRQIEDVHGASIDPGSGPFPPGDAVVRTPAASAHPEQRQSSQPRLHAMETAAQLAGRLLFGGFFLYNGVNHYVNREGLSAYARNKGVRAPTLAVAGSGLLLVAGGLSLVTGAWPKLGAGLVSTFLLGVSPRMHAFWREQDPQMRTNEMVNFTKNMALVGGSLFAAAQPEPWPWRAPIRRSRILAARS
jgi:putative oxidoreductase